MYNYHNSIAYKQPPSANSSEKIATELNLLYVTSEYISQLFETV